MQSIENVMTGFDFKGKSGSLQYWIYTSDGNGWSLRVAGQPFLPNLDKTGLRNYRNKCIRYGEVRHDTYGRLDCFAGEAAQRRVPLERTNRDPTQCLGQLVVPVFRYLGAQEILGVIELVTHQPKESYAEDLNQISNLLLDEDLATA